MCVIMPAASASSMTFFTAGRASWRKIFGVWNTSVPEPPTHRKSGLTSSAITRLKRVTAFSIRSSAHCCVLVWVVIITIDILDAAQGRRARHEDPDNALVAHQLFHPLQTLWPLIHRLAPFDRLPAFGDGRQADLGGGHAAGGRVGDVVDVDRLLPDHPAVFHAARPG